MSLVFLISNICLRDHAAQIDHHLSDELGNPCLLSLHLKMNLIQTLSENLECLRMHLPGIQTLLFLTNRFVYFFFFDFLPQHEYHLCIYLRNEIVIRSNCFEGLQLKSMSYLMEAIENLTIFA